MPYDSRVARSYDEVHAAKFAVAEEVAAALAAVCHDGPPSGDSPPRALELGVGTGRVALPLAAMGIEVHGVDTSEAMLRELASKPGAESVRLVTGDFADVGSIVEGTFSLAFVVDSTLFELPSQEAQVRCFAGVAEHLAPGGAFVVEALAPDITRLEQSVHPVDFGTSHVRLQATRHDPATQTVAGQNVVISEGSLELWPWSIRYASVPELDLMARLAGLRLRHRWGGWDGREFTAASTHHVSVYSAD